MEWLTKVVKAFKVGYEMGYQPYTGAQVFHLELYPKPDRFENVLPTLRQFEVNYR